MAIFFLIYPQSVLNHNHIATNRPNVVLIVTMTQGYGKDNWLSTKNKDISTPFLDSCRPEH